MEFNQTTTTTNATEISHLDSCSMVVASNTIRKRPNNVICSSSENTNGIIFAYLSCQMKGMLKQF
jgi:hypothetical protein